MKIKKSKFAKLLMLPLPIAAISILSPVVLTSCGSSNTNNGGSSGDDSADTTQSYTASWKTNTNTIDGLSFNDNTAIITLKDNANFGGTSISKTSKYVDIVSSLSPNTSSTKSSEVTKEGTTSTPSADSTKTLYSVLSGLINNVDKFTVKLSINPNPVVFDFTNDSIGNSFSGKFVLTPIKDKNSASENIELKFTINNFDDSTNFSNKLMWNTEQVENTLKKGQANTGNNIPDQTVTTMGGDASAIIDLSKLSKESDIPTYSQVMNELCSTSITGTEISKFITSSDNTYDVSKATFSSWAPTVDQKMIFTRIVIPNNEETKQSAIMYLAYTGYKADVGSATWNRNLGYYDVANPSKNLWDKIYDEPVISLSTDKLWNTNISSSSKANDIVNKGEELATYIAQNYILDVGNFDLNNSKDIIQVGSFDRNGKFQVNTKSVATTNDAENTIITNNKNVIAIKFFLKLKESQSGMPKGLNGKDLSGYSESEKGFWKAFYITGYSTE